MHILNVHLMYKNIWNPPWLAVSINHYIVKIALFSNLFTYLSIYIILIITYWHIIPFNILFKRYQRHVFILNKFYNIKIHFLLLLLSLLLNGVKQEIYQFIIRRIFFSFKETWLLKSYFDFQTKYIKILACNINLKLNENIKSKLLKCLFSHSLFFGDFLSRISIFLINTTPFTPLLINL